MDITFTLLKYWNNLYAVDFVIYRASDITAAFNLAQTANITVSGPVACRFGTIVSDVMAPNLFRGLGGTFGLADIMHENTVLCSAAL